jgi:hypothetical protein
MVCKLWCAKDPNFRDGSYKTSDSRTFRQFRRHFFRVGRGMTQRGSLNRACLLRTLAETARIGDSSPVIRRSPWSFFLAKQWT